MVIGKCAVGNTLPVIDYPFQSAEKLRRGGDKVGVGASGF